MNTVLLCTSIISHKCIAHFFWNTFQTHLVIAFTDTSKFARFTYTGHGSVRSCDMGVITYGYCVNIATLQYAACMMLLEVTLEGEVLASK